MDKKFLSLCLVTILLVAGCSNGAQGPTNHCIPPDVTFAFPVGKPSSTLLVTPTPPQSAALGFDLPEEFYSASSMVFHKGSLWLLAGLTGKDHQEYTAFVRYNPASGDWKEYKLVSGRDFRADSAWQLKTSPEKELWAILETSMQPEVPPDFFIKYDETLDRFDYVPYQGEYFREQAESIRKEIYSYELDSSFGPDGRLWMTDRYNLYEFNVETLEVVKKAHAESGSVFSYVKVGPDNMVWLLDLEKSRILRYVPDTGELKAIYAEFDTQPTSTFLDSRGRFWVSDFGWLDTQDKNFLGDPLWYTIVRPSIFIGQPHSAENQYIWRHPSILGETSDGSIWFEVYYFALVKLDPERGNWCKIASYGSSLIAEDDKRNVWVLHNNKLYKLPLNP